MTVATVFLLIVLAVESRSDFARLIANGYATSATRKRQPS